MNPGILSAIGAYTTWGLLPIYWKLLQHVPAAELTCHRIFWSFLTLVAFLQFSKRLGSLRRMCNRRVFSIYMQASVLIGINWSLYIWSVNAGFIVEASLGYFINPLLSVLFGVIFFRERLRPAQWIPIITATLGVLYLTLNYGRPPWIALILAITFSLYGLVKKRAPLPAFEGLTLETGLLVLPAFSFLLWQEQLGVGAFLHAGTFSDSLLVGAGVATTAPLIMFATAAQRIPLSMIGFLQYIAPTIQFLLGVFLYNEPFTRTQAIGFGAVWVAVVLFLLERWRAVPRISA